MSATGNWKLRAFVFTFNKEKQMIHDGFLHSSLIEKVCSKEMGEELKNGSLGKVFLYICCIFWNILCFYLIKLVCLSWLFRDY